MVNYSRQTRPYLFILVLFLLNSVVFINSHGVKLDLIRPHRPGLSGIHTMTQVAHRDAARALRARQRHATAAKMPLNAGADLGAAQYLVQFRVGTPPQTFALIADTGSDLTWMNCHYGCPERRCPRWSARRRAFNAKRSSSFRTVPCSSRTCKIDLSDLFSLVRCPTPRSPCLYDYRYSDGSAAIGLFANETATLGQRNGRRLRIPGVVIGCTQSSRVQSFKAAEGVMGLGYSNSSFAVKATQMFGGKFSYCLVDHLSHRNVSSYLVFGSHQAAVSLSHTTMHFSYTALVLGEIPPFYAVKLRSITYGGTKLTIPSETWNFKGAGGVVLDSGASLTALTTPAYKPVMSALKQSLQGFKKLDQDIGPLQYCFNSTGFTESVVPALVFHFADGARFQPPVKNYVITVDDNVKCLGFVAAAWPGPSIIGNIMQQGHLWEFDLANRKLGFARSSCS